MASLSQVTMPNYPKESDLQTESDVEQKLVWTFLTQASPLGLGCPLQEIRTKLSIRRFEIGKGGERKLYFPDYIITALSLPLLVVEVKEPGGDINAARREARLYATELNALFESYQNPCRFTLVSNGKITSLQSWDSDTPLAQFTLEEAEASNINFSKVIDILKYDRLQAVASHQLSTLRRIGYTRPIFESGGQSVRNEEIAPNTFGTSFVLDFQHIFNPSNSEDRAYVVKNAYIPSHRRARYLNEIDRVIKAAAPPSESDAKTVEDTSHPNELISKFNVTKQLEHKILLLIGAVGAGKSTFVDYVKEVALPKSAKDKTVWVHLNLNVAPVDKGTVYRWIHEELISKMPKAAGDFDMESISELEKLYGIELRRLKKGALALLPEDSLEYKTRLADEIIRLQGDSTATVKAMERYLCTERGRLLVIVLDNCDKRGRDEQLLMFQVAEWLQATFRALVVLPLRDVTYDNHRHEPPLDTAIKELVFRIEPPNFQNVLQARVNLAFKEMKMEDGNHMLSYSLPNGMKVEYPSSKLGMFLASIMRSLYEHDTFLRRMITGLAGRDVRRALEIFLEFCTSGHIDESEILKITTAQGHYALPYHVVSKVLLRRNRRFFDGDSSFVKNIFQVDPSELRPNHFTRYCILHWLRSKMAERGPNGVRGFHKASTLLEALSFYGVSSARGLEEILYLVKAMCVVPEHQLYNKVTADDLISITPAGYVHLDLVGDLNYLAACSEDLWFADRQAARDICGRMVNRKWHFSYLTTLLNAQSVADYLQDCANSALDPDPQQFLTGAPLAMPDFDKTRTYLKTQIASIQERRKAWNQEGR